LRIGTNTGSLYALNASNGNMIWNYTTGGLIESSTAVAGGNVYVGSDDGNVYAFGPSSVTTLTPTTMPSPSPTSSEPPFTPALPSQSSSSSSRSPTPTASPFEKPSPMTSPSEKATGTPNPIQPPAMSQEVVYGAVFAAVAAITIALIFVVRRRQQPRLSSTATSPSDGSTGSSGL